MVGVESGRRRDDLAQGGSCRAFVAVLGVEPMADSNVQEAGPEAADEKTVAEPLYI